MDLSNLKKGHEFDFMSDKSKKPVKTDESKKRLKEEKLLQIWRWQQKRKQFKKKKVLEWKYRKKEI